MGTIDWRGWTRRTQDEEDHEEEEEDEDEEDRGGGRDDEEDNGNLRGPGLRAAGQRHGHSGPPAPHCL